MFICVVLLLLFVLLWSLRCAWFICVVVAYVYDCYVYVVSVLCVCSVEFSLFLPVVSQCTVFLFCVIVILYIFYCIILFIFGSCLCMTWVLYCLLFLYCVVFMLCLLCVLSGLRFSHILILFRISRMCV